jgi:hypothetical protein
MDNNDYYHPTSKPFVKLLTNWAFTVEDEIDLIREELFVGPTAILSNSDKQKLKNLETLKESILNARAQLTNLKRSVKPSQCTVGVKCLVVVNKTKELNLEHLRGQECTIVRQSKPGYVILDQCGEVSTSVLTHPKSR